MSLCRVLLAEVMALYCTLCSGRVRGENLLYDLWALLVSWASNKAKISLKCLLAKQQTDSSHEVLWNSKDSRSITERKAKKARRRDFMSQNHHFDTLNEFAELECEFTLVRMGRGWHFDWWPGEECEKGLGRRQRHEEASKLSHLLEKWALEPGTLLVINYSAYLDTCQLPAKAIQIIFTSFSSYNFHSGQKFHFNPLV